MTEERRIKIKRGPGPPLEQKDLFTRVDVKSDPEACWPWMAGRTTAGYGSFYRRQKHILAHRDAYEFANGPIPEGMHVLHRCDNPPCCNPRHLFLGTQAENVADMKAKNRTASGERHSQARHSDETLKAAAEAYLRGEGSTNEIGRRFGIAGSHISRVVNGVRRKHIHESLSIPAAPRPPA